MKSAVFLLLLVICSYEHISGVSANGLKITGLKYENEKGSNQTHLQYTFKEVEELQLTCLAQGYHGRFIMTWYKNGVNLLNVSKSELKYNFTLHEKDDKSQITCSYDEDIKPELHPHRENITILLLYEGHLTSSTTSTTATTITSTTTRPNTQLAVTSQIEATSIPETPLKPQIIVLDTNTMIFASCGIVAIIIIIILIYIIIKKSRKRHTSEDKRHLHTTNSSVKSQSTESIGKIDATYTCPRDATHRNGLQDSTIRCNVYQSDTYSVPFTETRDVYSVPMPKKFRSLKTPLKEDNLSNNKYYTYAKTYQNGYSNVDPKNTNIKEYENLKNDLINEAPSNYYSEVNN